MWSLIEFVGSWNARERQSLTRLIERLEETIGLSTYGDATCAPWVCARHDDADGPALLVSRIHLQRTYVARTTRQLAKELAKLMPADRRPRRPR